MANFLRIYLVLGRIFTLYMFIIAYMLQKIAYVMSLHIYYRVIKYLCKFVKSKLALYFSPL